MGTSRRVLAKAPHNMIEPIMSRHRTRATPAKARLLAQFTEQQRRKAYSMSGCKVCHRWLRMSPNSERSPLGAC
jgi:hypothetical protein